MPSAHYATGHIGSYLIQPSIVPIHVVFCLWPCLFSVICDLLKVQHYSIYCIYNRCQKPLGHLEETDKKPLSSTYCHSFYKHAPPFPLEQCWFACWTFEVGMHAKFSHYRGYFSRKPTLFQGERGIKVRCRIQKVQSVPGLLASIVVCWFV